MTKKKDLRPIRLLKRNQFRDDAKELAPYQALAKAYIRQQGTPMTYFTIQHEDGCLLYGTHTLVSPLRCTCNHPRLFDREGVEFFMPDESK
jgi:hypothetical protein